MMPEIIPMRELKNTAAIAELVENAQEPVFITKNGRGKMVIMNMDVYDRNFYMQQVYEEVKQAERSIADGKTTDVKQAIGRIRDKYGL